MRRCVNRIWTVLVACFLLLAGYHGFAQTDPYVQARQYADSKDYDKAIELYKKLYNDHPMDVYGDYLNTLIAAKDYKEAEHLAGMQNQYRKDDVLFLISMGRIYEADGKEKKAGEQYDALLDKINGDDMLTQRIATAFTDIGKDQYAIKTYEKAREIIGVSYLYATALAQLYAKTGDLDKAVSAVLNSNPNNYVNVEAAKTTLLQMLGDDPKKLQLAQKAMVKKINEQPDNPYYGELLTWVYTQKNDWDGALIQIEAIDERNREDGHRLMEFARTAVKAKQYGVAVKAYDEVVAKGDSLQYYLIAQTEKLNASFRQIQADPAYKIENAKALAAQYDTFLAHNPRYYGTETASDLATIDAQYADQLNDAIALLERAIVQPDARRNVIGSDKLQLGDYYVIAGKIWDASLLYSQVDKEFKEDMLGEEARFRNAKLAYYRGDFKWAQLQLSVLKRATSQLIANDALYLSVLITENTEADSNLVPLQRFAAADLLLFQNKDKEAESLLDSIAAAFPKHPLNDDILMLRAKIAEKHRDYTKELAYLKQIIDQYGTDVLGDDAEYKTAQIYDDYLHDKEQAKHYYEQLIIDYPGSTFVQVARQRLHELNEPTVQ